MAGVRQVSDTVHRASPASPRTPRGKGQQENDKIHQTAPDPLEGGISWRREDDLGLNPREDGQLGS